MVVLVGTAQPPVNTVVQVGEVVVAGVVFRVVLVALAEHQVVVAVVAGLAPGPPVLVVRGAGAKLEYGLGKCL